MKENRGAREGKGGEGVKVKARGKERETGSRKGRE